MSVYLPPEEGPFVFGAYAASLNERQVPEQAEADAVAAAIKADLAEPAPKLAS
jgi:hypothetical protein